MKHSLSGEKVFGPEHWLQLSQICYCDFAVKNSCIIASTASALSHRWITVTTLNLDTWHFGCIFIAEEMEKNKYDVSHCF